MPTAILKTYDLIADETGGYCVNDIASVICLEMSEQDFLDDKKLFKHIKNNTNLIKKYARLENFEFSASEDDTVVYIDHKCTPLCEVHFEGGI